MSYLIMRTEKLKTNGNISGAGAHVSRDRETKNADPNKKNYLLHGNKSVLESCNIRLKKSGAKFRSNSVKLIEVFLGVSPDYFKKNKIKPFIIQSKKWLFNEFGKDNVINITLHKDESTAHIHAFVVPVDDTGGKVRLNAKRWLGGRSKLSNLQTRAHGFFKVLGLKRGIQGSVAKHQNVKRFYADKINKKNNRTVLAPKPFLQTPSSYQAEAQDKIDQLEDELNRAKVKLKMEEKRKKEMEETATRLQQSSWANERKKYIKKIREQELKISQYLDLKQSFQEAQERIIAVKKIREKDRTNFQEILDHKNAELKKLVEKNKNLSIELQQLSRKHSDLIYKTKKKTNERRM